MNRNGNDSAPLAPRPPADLNPRHEPVLDFPDRELGSLTLDDYDALGFMCGLEVHQQALTSSKLFCRCPAGRRARSSDADVLRRMRPTLSELGEYDGTALMEFKTRKEIVYRLERESVCTYEIDDTPPFEIDPEAVRIAVEVALLFNLRLVSELHVMRKQYLDGSIPAGFQRTAMIALDGRIPFRVPELGVDRELGIRQLSLEEDSCREISDVGHRITFSTDRLGTPLTEVVTEPELLTPWEVEAGGRLIAAVTRSAGKVRRGPGAARQDVNVSVAGGRRVEIKGVARHRELPLLVHNEAYRQLNLLRIREELRRRGVEPSMLALPDGGWPWESSRLVTLATSLLRRCDFAPIRDSIERGDVVAAMRLPGFAGFLTRITQPGVTFAHEFSDRVRVIACLEARPFMLHSDLRDWGLRSSDWRALRRRLRASGDDAVVIVWGPEQDVATAAHELSLRACEALEGVPPETRQALPDGTNGFERILPGPDRMYPDTDTPPLPIADSVVAEIASRPAERPWEREARYIESGLDPAAARRLAGAPWAGLFERLKPAAGSLARRAAFALEKRLPYHRREGRLDGAADAERLAPALREIENGTIRVEALETALDALIERPADPVDRILERFRRGPDDEARLDARVEQVTLDAAALDGRTDEVRHRWAMGQTMPGFLGRLAPSVVQSRLAAALAASPGGRKP